MHRVAFQSSPVPEDGCNGATCGSMMWRMLFQSSPVPEDGCNQTGGGFASGLPTVSILTRPGGRVQPHGTSSSRATVSPVSILTRPEGRVQPEDHTSAHTSSRFQSSPVPKDGCNLTISMGSASRRCFNPHPSRRTGATPPQQPCFAPGGAFQSSPVPKDGCNPEPVRPHNRARLVSILTRPEGRVQPGDRAARSAPLGSFNPHPSRRTGATPHKAHRPASAPGVSILTRPEGRVQRDILRAF